MTDLVTELTGRAMALSPEERARLAEELLATLEPGDDGVEAAWDAEIRRRIDEVESEPCNSSLPMQRLRKCGKHCVGGFSRLSS